MQVTLLDRPNGKAIATVQKGDKVQGLTGIVYTVPRRVEVVYPHRSYKPGDVFFILTYLGEGHAKIWYDGKVIPDEDINDLMVSPRQHFALDCAAGSPSCWWKMDPNPSHVTWWVKVRTGEGVVGWAISSGNFGNQDACG